MRALLIAGLALVTTFSYPGQAQTAQSRPARDRAIIQRRKILLVRSAALAKQFPDRRTAIVMYPVISGLDPIALRRVRSLLSFKNIFDYSLQEYRTDAWLTEFTFDVNHNADYLLDITFMQSGMAAYPDEQSKHFLINIRNGNKIIAKDAFQIATLETLAALVDKRLQDEIDTLKKDNAGSSDIDPVQKESINDAYSVLKFEIKDLDDFSVSQKGITFLYDAGFPHVIKALEPHGRYVFTFAELKPYIKTDGPLGQFVRKGLE